EKQHQADENGLRSNHRDAPFSPRNAISVPRDLRRRQRRRFGQRRRGSGGWLVTSCDYSTSGERRRKAKDTDSEGAILNLIIVDDDVDIRRGLAILLRSHGHTVTVFRSAEEYLAQPVEAHCVILDIALPGISGLELSERLKAGGRGVPIVFITAHIEPSV